MERRVKMRVSVHFQPRASLKHRRRVRYSAEIGRAVEGYRLDGEPCNNFFCPQPPGKVELPAQLFEAPRNSRNEDPSAGRKRLRMRQPWIIGQGSSKRNGNNFPHRRSFRMREINTRWQRVSRIRLLISFLHPLISSWCIPWRSGTLAGIRCSLNSRRQGREALRTGFEEYSWSTCSRYVSFSLFLLERL